MGENNIVQYGNGSNSYHKVTKFSSLTKNKSTSLAAVLQNAYCKIYELEMNHGPDIS